MQQLQVSSAAAFLLKYLSSYQSINRSIVFTHYPCRGALYICAIITMSILLGFYKDFHYGKYRNTGKMYINMATSESSQFVNPFLWVPENKMLNDDMYLFAYFDSVL